VFHDFVLVQTLNLQAESSKVRKVVQGIKCRLRRDIGTYCPDDELFFPRLPNVAPSELGKPNF